MSISNTRRTVHPHACGEYGQRFIEVGGLTGSSPRVWGILSDAAGALHVERFIPTRVGNTRQHAGRDKAGAVHPHACGEYIRTGGHKLGQRGSSPRVWGIRELNAGVGRPQRFIPTRVGNTCSPMAGRGRQTVHPHACGEYLEKTKEGLARAGSSPRVWGIHTRAERQHWPKRFIPTRVGNTAVALSRAVSMTVHPHACGEYRPESSALQRSSGSSPRVWGILFRKMQEITDCWQSSSVLPSHACCKPAPMTIKRGRSFVKRLLPLVKHCPAGQSRSLDVTCPDRRNARPRS